MTTQHLRLGLTLPLGEGFALADQLDLVRHAEALGYDSVWLGESWGRELFTTLTWLACHTSTIKLGAGIANVFSRTPALLAQTVATLDLIAGGRLLLGLGTSGQAVVERWHGVPFQRGSQRLREYAEIVRLALRGERVDYQGQVFNLRGFRLGVTPARREVPIYFAAITSAGFKMTGEVADGWLPIWTGPTYLATALAEVRRAAQAAGRSPEAIDVAAEVHTAVSPGPEVRDLARAHLARYLGGMGVYYHRLASAQGFGQEADAVRDAYARHQRDEAARLIPHEMLDELALVGDAAHCRRWLSRYRDAGVGLPVLNFVDGLTKQQVRATLEALAP